MESSDKKKIILILATMVIAMVSMSIFMRTGFESIKKEKRKKTQDVSAGAESEVQKEEENTGIKYISIRVNGESYLMSVDSGKAGQEFATSTPFELEMLDLNNNEKYYTGSDTLPVKNYKPEHINAGDVMLYGDNTIVIFYKSFDTQYEYTRLGRIVSPESLESVMGNGKVTVEFFKQEEK